MYRRIRPDACCLHALACQHLSHPLEQDPSDYRPTFSKEITDYLFRCSSYLWPNALSALNVPVYVYRYVYLYSCSAIFPHFGLPKWCADHVCHAADIPFMMGMCEREGTFRKEYVCLVGIDKRDTLGCMSVSAVAP